MLAAKILTQHAREQNGDWYTQPTGTKINPNLLADKADELDKKIKELTAMRDGLRHAAACAVPNHFECPKFLRLLKIAGKKGKKKSDIGKK